MKNPIETERLILRELALSDAEGMFELDSNPNVHLFVGNRPVKHIEESIEYIQFVQKQYKDFGIGRWAVILKETNEYSSKALMMRLFIFFDSIYFVFWSKNEIVNGNKCH